MKTAELLAPAPATISARTGEVLDNLGAWLGHGRFDSWENSVTGFGTLRDKTIFSAFMPTPMLGDVTLEQLYHHDDLAARMIDTVPEEMLRKGYCLDIEDSQDLAEDTIAALTELDANSKIIEAEIWAKTFGGAVLIPVADDGFPAYQPLRPERVKAVTSLEVIDRRFVYPHSFYRTGPKRDQVEVYAVGSVGHEIRPEFLIHETRMIVFRGARTSRTQRMYRNHWDVSALQRPYEVMRAFATGFKSVELLLSDGPQGVYGIKDLHRLIAGNNQAAIDARLEAVDKMRSALRAIAIDKEYESFSGIPDVLDKLMLRLAASVRMPVTILMGQSPAGMNATGESDFRWFYDRVETEQKNYLSPRLRQLINLILASKEGPSSGKAPEKFSIDFEALWTLDPKSEAERRASVATTDKIYIDAGVLMPEEVALSRFGERGWQPGYDAFERDLRRDALDKTVEEIEAGEKAPPTQELLTPTANETITTVNEARAAKGLPPEEDEEIGNMKVAAYRAMQEAEAAKLGQAAAAEETGQPTDEEIKLAQAEAGVPPGAPGAPGQGPPGAPGAPVPGKPGAAPAPSKPGLPQGQAPQGKEPAQSATKARKPSVLARKQDAFNEDDHPRAEDGEFTAGSDSNNGSKDTPRNASKKTAGKQTEPGAEPKASEPGTESEASEGTFDINDPKSLRTEIEARFGAYSFEVARQEERAQDSAKQAKKLAKEKRAEAKKLGAGQDLSKASEAHALQKEADDHDRRAENAKRDKETAQEQVDGGSGGEWWANRLQQNIEREEGERSSSKEKRTKAEKISKSLPPELRKAATLQAEAEELDELASEVQKEARSLKRANETLKLAQEAYSSGNLKRAVNLAERARERAATDATDVLAHRFFGEDENAGEQSLFDTVQGSEDGGLSELIVHLIDGDGDGRTGKAEEEDDEPRKSAK
jgi:phage-related protein (TIGR01555 family)